MSSKAGSSKSTAVSFPRGKAGRRRRTRLALVGQREVRLGHVVRWRRGCLLQGVRDQHSCSRGGTAELPVPRRERVGGLARPLLRVPAARRRRGPPAQAMGLRPLPIDDATRLRRRLLRTRRASVRGLPTLVPGSPHGKARCPGPTRATRPGRGRSRRMAATTVDEEHRITPRELFFEARLRVRLRAGRDAALRRPDVRRDRPRRARAGRALVGLDHLRLADEHRRSRRGGGRCRAARRADRDVRRGARGAERVRRRRRSLRRLLPRRDRDAHRALRPRRPREPRPARSGAPAGPVDAARCHPHPRGRLPRWRARLALARRARGHSRRRRADPSEGLTVDARSV
jgi:hypothetical protein